MSHEQILAALEELSKKSGVLVAKEIIQFVPIYKEETRMIKTIPLWNWWMLLTVIVAPMRCPAWNPEKIKATEKHDKEAIALACVYYAMMGKLPQ